MKLGVVGGDLRIIRLMEMYLAEDNIIYAFGLEKYWNENSLFQYQERLVQCKELEQVTENCSYILSGIPFSKDKIKVNAPFSDKEIKVDTLKNKLEGKTFFAGGIPENFAEKKIHAIDLLKKEELTVLNAIPTVEGTIRIVIQEREETIHASNVLICGFGRIGKILCDRFQKLGANVYCAARKDADFAWMEEKRYTPLVYSEIAEKGKKFDIIINTVPNLVITQKELNAFRKDALLIELASSSGGMDQEYANKIGRKIITALGIPGKEMPKSAANYIKKVVDKYLR